MHTMKKMLARGALAALVSTAAIASMTTTASAYVVCDHYGDCYNVRPHHRYWPRGSVYYGSQATFQLAQCRGQGSQEGLRVRCHDRSI